MIGRRTRVSSDFAASLHGNSSMSRGRTERNDALIVALSNNMLVGRLLPFGL